MKRISHSEFLERVQEKHGDEIEILGEYKNKRTKVQARHICGYVWHTNPYTLAQGHGCPRCANNQPKNREQFIEEVSREVGDEYEVLGEYINTHTPTLFRHTLCGFEFLIAPNAFLHQGQRCPQERYDRAAEANRIPLQEVEFQVMLAEGESYKIIGNYQGVSKKASFVHQECGRQFDMAPNRFLHDGTRCPHCFIEQNRSRGETVIADYLHRHGLEFQSEYQIRGCRNQRPLRFDFAVFRSENRIQCLIEYDGSHHSSPKFPNPLENFRRTLDNDAIKNEYCREHSIPLLRINHVRTTKPEVFEKKIQRQLTQALANIS